MLDNYTDAYDNNDIRNNDYCVTNYIKEYYKNYFVCLDLGCGSCRKIKSLARNVKLYYAIDFSCQRIIEASNHCSDEKNIILGVGDNFYLPFKNNKFDLVSSFMTKYSITEAYRVLKTKGLFIIETVGANDKRDIKVHFGKDQLGFRGRMLNDNTSVQISRIKKSLFPFFDIVRFSCLNFETTINSDMLIKLFKMTGEIRGFNEDEDGRIIDKLVDNNGNVKYNEERLIIICEKL